MTQQGINTNLNQSLIEQTGTFSSLFKNVDVKSSLKTFEYFCPKLTI